MPWRGYPSRLRAFGFVNEESRKSIADNIAAEAKGVIKTGKRIRKLGHAHVVENRIVKRRVLLANFRMAGLRLNRV